MINMKRPILVPVLSFARVHTLVTFSNITTHCHTQEYTLPHTGTHTHIQLHTAKHTYTLIHTQSSFRANLFSPSPTLLTESSVLSPRFHTNMHIITFVLLSPRF